MKYKTTKDELEKIIKESHSIADACRSLNIVPVGGNYRTVKTKIKQWNINTYYFTGQAWNVGDRFKPFCKITPLSEILIENSLYTSNGNLKKKLFKEGIKKDECENCGLSMWMGKKLSIELHHNNGNNSDHRIENLKMLCPNCHSQTPTFRGRNLESSINKNRKEKFTLSQVKKERFKVPITSTCLNCGKLNKRNSRKFCSTKCMFESQLKAANIPSKDDLQIKINELKSFLQVGKFYGKSDKTIKKWCNRYNIIK